MGVFFYGCNLIWFVLFVWNAAELQPNWTLSTCGVSRFNFILRMHLRWRRNDWYRSFVMHARFQIINWHISTVAAASRAHHIIHSDDATTARTNARTGPGARCRSWCCVRQIVIFVWIVGCHCLRKTHNFFRETNSRARAL